MGKKKKVIEVVEVEEKRRGGCLKPILIFFLIVIALAAFSPNKNNDATSTKSKNTVTATPTHQPTNTPKSTKTPIPTATPTAKPTNTPKPTKTPKPTATTKPTNVPVSKDEMKSMIENMLGNAYSYCLVEILDEGFSIAVSTENIGQAAYYANATQNEEFLKEWDTMCTNMVYKCIEIQEYVESYGLQNQLIMFSLVNDENTDLSLVSIINGAIIYNAVK